MAPQGGATHQLTSRQNLVVDQRIEDRAPSPAERSAEPLRRCSGGHRTRPHALSVQVKRTPVRYSHFSSKGSTRRVLLTRSQLTRTASRPVQSCVVPRPIGWISSRSTTGRDNLAPYSQFTNVSFDPAMVMFSANQTPDGDRKDTVVNAESTGVFVWNMATWALRHAVNRTAEALPADTDEFERAQLGKQEARLVGAPMVADSPIRFECEYMQTVRLPGGGAMGTVDLVFGRVVGVHIDDAALTEDGRINILEVKPIARMGYFDYTAVESSFEMVIPGDPRILTGLEGSATGNRDLGLRP